MNLIIESKDNKTIKEIKKLHEKKYRNASKKFIVEGTRFVEEALKSDFEIEYVIINEKLKEKVSSIVPKCNTKVLIVSESIFESICSTENPQGIACVVKNKKLNPNLDDGFYVLLDKVQDPGNLGTIIRTANAAGASGVILIKGTVDVYNDKTLRATMGSIFKIPIILDDDLSFTLNLKDNGFKIITSSLDTDMNFYSLNLKNKVIIAIGNEGNGISSTIYDISDYKVKVPMPGNAESLNASVAAGIMMFEIVRQNMLKS